MNKLTDRQSQALPKKANAKPRRVPKFRKAKPGEGERAAARFRAIVEELAKFDPLTPCNAVDLVRYERGEAR